MEYIVTEDGPLVIPPLVLAAGLSENYVEATGAERDTLLASLQVEEASRRAAVAAGTVPLVTFTTAEG